MRDLINPVLDTVRHLVVSLPADPPGGGYRLYRVRANVPGYCAAVSHRKHGPPVKVNEEQPVASGVPERALAVLGAGTGDLLGFRHIHPPSTIQRCAVQERESSAASHNKIRATSSGYSLCGRHWLRRIESSASGVTQ